LAERKNTRRVATQAGYAVGDGSGRDDGWLALDGETQHVPYRLSDDAAQESISHDNTSS